MDQTADHYRRGRIGNQEKKPLPNPGLDTISLDELAGRLPKAGILESKLLHLSACSVLHDEDACKALLDTSGAQAITGFTKDVDWLESLAFELLMFNAFAGYQRLGNFVRSMNKNYGEFSERLGFTVIR